MPGQKTPARKAAALRKRPAKPRKRRRSRWRPTVKESKMPWRDASQPEKRRRLTEFLSIIRAEGEAGSVEISLAHDKLLQSVEAKVRLKKRGLIATQEISLLRNLYHILEGLGTKVPDIEFELKKK